MSDAKAIIDRQLNDNWMTVILEWKLLLLFHLALQIYIFVKIIKEVGSRDLIYLLCILNILFFIFVYYVHSMHFSIFKLSISA